MSKKQFYAPIGVADTMLASGRRPPIDDTFDLTDEEIKDPHNARLIEEGKIKEVPAKKAKPRRSAESSSSTDNEEGGEQ